MKKAKIFYFTLQDEQTKEEKLDWIADRKFEEIPFDHITPDRKGNWINLTDNDIEPYGLTRTDATTNTQPKAKLKADKEKGYIDLDGITFLQDIPAIAWDYKLGNR